MGLTSKIKKGQVIYQHQIEKSDVEEYISWAKQEGIEYGLVGSHDAKLSTRTDMISEAINPIYPDLDVDPNFHEKEDIYQMWTFEDKGDDLHLPDSLSAKLRMVRWHQHSSDIVPISGSKATGVEKVVEHLGLKPEMSWSLEMASTTWNSLIMLESALPWEFLMITSKKKQIILQKH